MRLPNTASIRTINGQRVKLCDLEKKRRLYIRSVENGVVVKGGVYDLRLLGTEKEWLSIRTSRRYRAALLPENIVMTPDGERTAGELKPGDRVMTNGIRLFMDNEWLFRQHYVKRRSIQEIADECNVKPQAIGSQIQHLKYKGIRKNTGRPLRGPVVPKESTIREIRNSRVAWPIFELNVLPKSWLVVGEMIVKVT